MENTEKRSLTNAQNFENDDDEEKGLFWIWCSITGNHDYELWHWSASSRPRLGPGKEFPHDAGGDLASVSGNCLIVIDAQGPHGYHTVWSEQLGNIQPEKPRESK